MKRVLLLVVLLTLLVPASSFGQFGPYASFRGAVVFQQDWTGTSEGISGTVDFGTSPAFAIGAGYAFGNGLRAGLEFDYRDVRIEGGTAYLDRPRSFDLDGRLHIRSFLANVLYVYEDAPYPVLPYVGGGVGWARAKASYTDPIRISSEAENVVAYQTRIGIKVPIPYAELDLGYKLMGTSEIDDGTLFSHNVEAGVTLRF